MNLESLVLINIWPIGPTTIGGEENLTQPWNQWLLVLKIVQRPQTKESSILHKDSVQKS
jgi:hypothetical protein